MLIFDLHVVSYCILRILTIILNLKDINIECCMKYYYNKCVENLKTYRMIGLYQKIIKQQYKKSTYFSMSSKRVLDTKKHTTINSFDMSNKSV